MPLVLGTLTALYDAFPNWSEVRPQMGESTCFLSMKGARFFFYMPILILLCFNTLMYLGTVYGLWKTKRDSKKAAVNRITINTRRSVVLRENHVELSNKEVQNLVCSTKLMGKLLINGKLLPNTILNHPNTIVCRRTPSSTEDP